MRNPCFEALFRQAPAAYLLVSADLRVLDANAAYLQLTGRSLADIRGLPVFEAFAPEPESAAVAGILRASMLRAAEEGVADHVPVVRYPIAPSAARDTLPEDRYWTVTNTPVRAADGSVAAVLHHARDVTHRVGSSPLLFETERDAAQVSLFQAQKLEVLSRVTRDAMHAFNNLLQVAGGNLQLLRRFCAEDSRASQRLDAALEALTGAGELGRQLQCMARGQDAGVDCFSLGELLTHVQGLLRHTLDVEFELSGLPDDRLQADRGLLEVALLNLLLGLRGQDVERVQGRISVVADFGQPSVCLELSWVPASTEQQVDSRLLARFVMACGGQLRWSDVSTLRMELPLAGVAEAGGSDSMPVTEAASALRVLIVEDDPSLRMLTREVMTEFGHHAGEVESAEAALVLLEHQAFDVLFTDIGLPGMSGLDLLRKVCPVCPDMAAVIASGHPIDPDAEGVAGVQVLIKPYDLPQLQAVLERISAQRSV